MRRRQRLFLCCLLPALAAATVPDYRFDAASSHANFRVRLFWLDKIDGHFPQVTGTVLPDAQGDRFVVDATIDVNSITMDSKRLRQWVLSREFFDAAAHPQIHFVSDALPRQVLEHGGELTGALTLRGITAPIRFELQPEHCTTLATPCALMLNGRLQRSRFGMTADRLSLSDEVSLELAITLRPDTQ